MLPNNDTTAVFPIQFKTLDDPATWPTEIAIEFPGLSGMSMLS